jgi:hypothetical protein
MRPAQIADRTPGAAIPAALGLVVILLAILPR